MEHTIDELQTLLSQLGYLGAGYQEGVLDEPTIAALRLFQRCHALAQTREPDEPTWNALATANRRGECVVVGRVTADGAPIDRVAIEVRDRDLGDEANWPVLGTPASNPDGHFVLMYTMEQVLPGDRRIGQGAIADLMFRVRSAPGDFAEVVIVREPEEQPLDAGDLSLGLQARRVERLRFELRDLRRRWNEGCSEYEQVLDAFRKTWPGVVPVDLDAKRREPEFAARELGVPYAWIAALVGAFSTNRTVFDGTMPEPILYALARSRFQLTDLDRIALASSGTLKDAIYSGMELLIIPPQADEIIANAIKTIRKRAPARLLASDDPRSLGAMLRSSLADDRAASALLEAAGDHANDAPSMWAALRANPAFAAPGAVERAQFALQLDALTGRHAPLMAALQRDHRIASARELLAFGRDNLAAVVGRGDVGPPPFIAGDNDQARVDAYVNGLMGQLHQAFPTETIADRIARAPDVLLGGAELRDQLASALQAATSADRRVAGRAFDIRSDNVDAYFAANPDILAGLDEAARPRLVGNLKRVQRLHAVSTSPEAFDFLLRAGFGSAHAIATMPAKAFVAQAGPVIGETEAMMMHNRAGGITATALATFVHLNDLLKGAHPAALVNGGEWIDVQPQLEAIVEKHLPSWSAMFKEHSFCACTACQSVFSPAAYLVDLLNMLDHKSGKDADGHSALDVLLERRPDIARLALDCENTNTVIPYVDLVNEILERLVIERDQSKLVAFDTGDATSDELRAAPRHVQWEAYVTPPGGGSESRLDAAVYPLSLPFDLPLASARAHFQSLKVSRAQLMEMFVPGPLGNARAAEMLGLAPEMFAAITGAAVEGTPPPADHSLDERYGFSLLPPEPLALNDKGRLVLALKRKLNAHQGAGLPLAVDSQTELFDAATAAAVSAFQGAYGLPVTGAVDAQSWTALAAVGPSLASALLPHVPTFLERTGLSFDEMHALLGTMIVNPMKPVFDVLVALGVSASSVTAFVAAGFQAPDADLVAALAKAGVAHADFADWAEAKLSNGGMARLADALVIHSGEKAPCDIEQMQLVHWGMDASAIDDVEWLRLDRFIRLWRATNWDVGDLGLALSALGATEITDAVVRQIAQICEAARLLDLSIAEVVALWGDLVPQPANGLYARHFLSRAVTRISEAFTPDWAGRFPVGAKVVDEKPALQAALRIGSADLDQLRRTEAIRDGNDADDDALDIPRMSKLLRYVLLARALELNVRDLLLSLAQTGIDPFVAPGDDWALLRLVADARQLDRLGLDVAQRAQALDFLSHSPPNEARDRLLAELGQALAAISSDFDAAKEGPDGSLTRRALTLLAIDPGTIEAAMRALLGTSQATVVLAAPPTPAPIVPPDWVGRVRFQPASADGTDPATLTITGTLTASEAGTVAGFSADATYQAAVAAAVAIPGQAVQALVDALAKVKIVLASAPTVLTASLNLPKAPDRESIVLGRFKAVLSDLLPPLHDRLKRELIKRSLVAIGLAPSSLALLLEGKLPSGEPVVAAKDGARTLIGDFLDTETAVGPAAAEAHELLVRFSSLTASLNLTPEDILHLVTQQVTLRTPADQLMDFAGWRRFAAYAELRAAPSTDRSALPTLWDATDVAGALTVLQAIYRWPAELIDALVDANVLGMTSLAALQDVERLAVFAQAGRMLAAVGAPIADVARWAREPIGPADADAIERWAKAGFDDEGWLAVARKASDTLRGARRDALVAYLLPRLGLSDADALFERLLIDVATDPVVGTSRIKQAISSVQLFVQRILLNLDPQAKPDVIDSPNWAWMSAYRVWEANRRILLYPENWIEPELRDDKSPFFTEFESALLQDDVTDSSVERALLDYLGKLDTVARLDVVTLCVQDSFESGEPYDTVVHVFGRTRNSPEAYYYRRYTLDHVGVASWSSWEKVPVDVRGSLVAAAIFHRRLFLFWAQTARKPKPVEGNATAPKDPELIQEISLSWSEYRDGAWSPKSTSVPEQVVDIELGEGGDTSEDGVERIETRIENGRLTVLLIGDHRLVQDIMGKYGPASKTSPTIVGSEIKMRGNRAYTQTVGSFMMDDCNGRLVAVSGTDESQPTTSGVVLRAFTGTLEANQLAEQPGPVETLLSATADDAAIAEETWIHYGTDYGVFSVAGRSYFAKLMTQSKPDFGLLHDSAFAVPKLKYAQLAQEQALTSTPNHEIKQIANLKVQAIQASNGWASANAALATSALVKGLAPLHVAPVEAAPAAGVSLKELGAADIYKVGRNIGLFADFVTIRFETLFHPFVCSYIESIAKFGVSGLYGTANQHLVLGPSFESRFKPNAVAVMAPYPADDVDFGEVGPGIYRTTAFANYNWELFFHIPMMVARRLRVNQRFEAARRWLHFVFDPTDGTGQYWKTKPLAKTPTESLQEWIDRLVGGDKDVEAQIAEWKDHPFEPHRIARMRLTAYKKYVVMEYLELLLDWADNLFAADTIEKINEATLLYIMAGHLLGKRPVALPEPDRPRALSFADMRSKLDALSNLVVETENLFPHYSSATAAPSPQAVGLLGVSQSLYFCVPPNDKLLGYWDTVADRLFKIRNSLNLAGKFRTLPLFEPPIDPAMLVRAAAAGIDVSSLMQDADVPRPFYRFPQALRDAQEACADVQSLGAQLLSAIEKKDAEELAMLRATQESAIQQQILDAVRQREEEADTQIEALKRNRAIPTAKLQHFRGLMGMTDAAVPEIGTEIASVPYDPEPASEGGVFLIEEEQGALVSTQSAYENQQESAATDIVAAEMHMLPNLTAVTAPFGTGIEMRLGQTNGDMIGAATSAFSRFKAMQASMYNNNATRTAKMGEFKRRQQGYAFEANTAALEIMHIDREILAAQIRKEIASKERQQVETRIAQAAAVEEHLRRKYSSSDLYAWMQGQITPLYFQAYQLAYNRARRAEAAYRFERGIQTSSYIRFGAWDNLHRGLLAGEALRVQLRQLEQAYADQNERDLEITRHVSLQQLAPLALVRLKEMGTCEFELPEWFFDMDYPGHYMRRLKAVSISMPAVIGPFGSVNATLTLLTNETRINTDLPNNWYERDLEKDDRRFVDDFTSLQSIVTSSGRDDGGLFELNLHDERYLPFEGGGAVSKWRLELDPDCNAIDLSDVILHVRYTARPGGALFAEKAKVRWKKLIASQEAVPLARMFSMKHDFPVEWHALRAEANAAGDHEAVIALTRNKFSALFQRSTIETVGIHLIAIPRDGAEPQKLPTIYPPGEDDPIDMVDSAPIEGALHRASLVAPKRIGDDPQKAGWKLLVPKDQLPASIELLDDLIVICNFTVKDQKN